MIIYQQRQQQQWCTWAPSYITIYHQNQQLYTGLASKSIFIINNDSKHHVYMGTGCPEKANVGRSAVVVGFISAIFIYSYFILISPGVHGHRVSRRGKRWQERHDAVNFLVTQVSKDQSVTFWCRYWSRDRNRDHFGLENGLETSLVTQVSKDIRTSLRKFIKSKFISSRHIGLP